MQAEIKRLKETKLVETPWAELVPGTNRPTGRLSSTKEGESWTWVGDLTALDMVAWYLLWEDRED